MTMFGGKQLVAKSKPVTSITSLPSKTIYSKIVVVTSKCFNEIFTLKVTSTNNLREQLAFRILFYKLGMVESGTKFNNEELKPRRRNTKNFSKCVYINQVFFITFLENIKKSFHKGLFPLQFRTPEHWRELFHGMIHSVLTKSTVFAQRIQCPPFCNAQNCCTLQMMVLGSRMVNQKTNCFF